MAEIVKGFLQGIMNKDADERLLPEGQYRDAVNIEVYNQEGSSTGSVHNKLGNTKIADLAVCAGQPTTTAKTIGAVTYEANNLIYWLVASDKFDGIYEFNTETNTITRIIQSNKPTPTDESKLNFRKEYPITGINYIPGRDELNNYLYWTDDYNPPRRVNISRAKTYSIDDDRIDNDLDVIVKPPLFAPAIYPYIDTTDPNSNNMKEKFLTFAYRWKYKDNQYSALSPFSAVAFAPGDYLYDYGVGNNASMTNVFNAVKIVCESGNELVDEIQIVLKDTRSPNANIIESISKSKLGISNNASVNFNFKSNKTYTTLPIDQVTRLFDNVPLLAKSQDIVGNRLAYGNYTQFRDITDETGNDILVDYKLDIVSEDIVSESDPKQTWRSDRDIEAGVIYGDDNGRMTTPITSANNSVYVPPSGSTKANKVKVQISSKPPSWATNYRIVVKESRDRYYNIFPITFYSDGLFRYFLIHQSDLDKVKVGEYVIFKKSSDGVTNSNKKYKVLEVESKKSNFLSGGSTTEIEGIYFKIKVDSITELSDVNIINFNSTSKGLTANSGENGFCNQKYGPKPIEHSSQWLDLPIYYGLGDPNRITLQNTLPPLNAEINRIGIEGNSDGTLSYYSVAGPDSQPIYISQNISPASTLDIYDTNGNYGFTVNIAPGSVFTEEDKWTITHRTQYWNSGSYDYSTVIFPGSGWGTPTADYADTPIFTAAVIALKLEEEGNPSEQPTIIFPPSPDNYANIEEWWYETSAHTYLKYYKSNGTLAELNSDRIQFGRGMFTPNASNPDWPASDSANQIDSGYPQNNYTRQYPVRILLRGSVYAPDIAGFFNDPCKQFYFKATFSIRQSSSTNICETSPKYTDLDIYHEVFQTHEIVDGKHTVLWNYDDYQFYAGNTKLTQLSEGKPHYFEVGHSVTIESANINGTYNIIQIDNQHSIIIDLAFPGAGPAIPGKVKFAGSLEQDQNGSTPAIIEINKPQAINSEYNAWTFGNGIESDRILDDWNETTKEFSVRAYTPFEGYRNVRNEASICYSGIYSENSSLNRLNEFNLSTANFKHLEKAFGSIQKLDARDTNLTVLQENKVSSVLYGKNILFDSTGGGQVASIPEVLGTQVPSNGEYGISKNPESFAKYGDYRFFTDARNGAVLMMDGNSDPVEISAAGMTDFFRDLMTENPTTEKLGCFDPHNKMYILASTEQEVIPCKLDLSRTSYTITKDASGFVAFSIVTDGPWTITRVDTGSGINWVTGYTQSGIGSQNVYVEVAANTTLSNRTIKFVVTYCDGLTQDFILTQARGRKGKVIIGVLNNDQTNSIKV